MHQLDVTLPGNHPAKHLFVVDYPPARDGGLAVAWLQQRKLAGECKKKAYQEHLATYVKEFSEQLAVRQECSADVALVPSSGSCLFEPYLKKLRELKPKMVVLEELFAKPEGFGAGMNGQTYKDALAGTILAIALRKEVIGASSILIIDDIYNTGNIAGANANASSTKDGGRPTSNHRVCALCPFARKK